MFDRAGRAIVGWVVGACILLASVPARADDRASSAQILFDDALALMNDKKFADACPKLEESQRIDPGMGTQFRLAECYEGLGKIASAWKLFVEVSDAAGAAIKIETNQTIVTELRAKEDYARQKAGTLRPRVPKLIVQFTDKADVGPSDIRRNGVPLDVALVGQPIPIDPGSVEVTVQNNGYDRWEGTVTVKEGETSTLTVPKLVMDGQGKPDRPGVAGPKGGSRGETTFKALAIVSGGLGVAGIALGTAMGFVAKGTYDEALDMCGGNPSTCGPDAIDKGDEAYTQATVSTVGFVAGGVLLATGVVLWIVAPDDEAPEAATAHVIPFAEPGSIGAGVAGRF